MPLHAIYAFGYARQHQTWNDFGQGLGGRNHMSFRRYFTIIWYTVELEALPRLLN